MPSTKKKRRSITGPAWRERVSRTGFRDPQYTHVILVRKPGPLMHIPWGRTPRGISTPIPPAPMRWEVFDYCRSREAAEELIRLTHQTKEERMIVERGALETTLMLINGE
jgi:hypothetical protein